MSFISGFKPPENVDPSAFWFIFKEENLLLNTQGDTLSIPETKDLGECRIHLNRQQFIGSLNGRQCYTADMGGGALKREGLEARNLRSLFNSVGEELIWAAGRANQLATWNRNHQYCGKCGASFEDKKDERAKLCPTCGLINYPRLSPAVIVAVIRDNKILLAGKKRFCLPFYTVLAGFVEPGETLEACVKRKIQEEIGIQGKNKPGD